MQLLNLLGLNFAFDFVILKKIFTNLNVWHKKFECYQF